MDIDPKISVLDALAAFDNNQSALARRLGLERSTVNEWISTEREFIPEIHAYRLQRLMPDVFGENCAA